MTRARLAWAVAVSVACVTAGSAAADKGVKAFPGAEGWGAVSVGGRGGKVIKVTNLNASGPGSFAEACATDGPRIVVFDVSGVIRGNVKITKPHLTIAGQTAPGAGIIVEGVISSYDLGVHDVIVRHLRVRRLRDLGAGGDCMQIGGRGPRRTGTYNIVLDHLSRSDLYIADEMFLVGTAAEVSSVNSVDDRPIPCPGPKTQAIADLYGRVVRGQEDQYKDWCELAV